MRTIFGFLLAFLLVSVSNSYACTTCGCTVNMLGKTTRINSQDSKSKWYFNYVYDQLVWKDKSAQEIHTLHHNDHEVHDKTTEVTHHFQLGRHFLNDDLNVFVDLPYVVRNSLEIHEHSALGQKQTSKGVGDLQLLSDYRFWHNDENALSVVAGGKFPTGQTHEENFQGERFEMDMQPGSGAYNAIMGGIYKFQNQQFSVTTNTTYVITQVGAQHFKYGNLYTVSLEGSYLLNPNASNFQAELGLDTVFQQEWKEKTDGVKNPDSGGQTVLMGPVFKMAISKEASLLGTFLYPVSQRLNGFTQKQAFNWTLTTKLRF